MSFISRGLAICAITVTAVAAAATAHAEIKGLELVVPAGPGGYDDNARAMQQVLQSKGLASSVRITNIPGAGGTTGLAQYVTTKRPNPSVFIGGMGLVCAVLRTNASVTLDQVAPLARLTGEYQPLFVAANSPIKTLDDLIRKFKADPGSVSWGGFGAGGPDHILFALIIKAAGGDVSRMKYVAAADGDVMAAVLGNKVTVGADGYKQIAEQLNAGKVRALAIPSPARLPGVNVPTLKEQGVDVEVSNWRAVFAPANLKPEEMKDYNDALGKMTSNDEWRALVKERGWNALYLPADKFSAFIKNEQARIRGALVELGLIK